VLKGKVAIVTGSSQGLGLEIARRFVKEGARVALCARNHSTLEMARVSLLDDGAGEDDVFAVAGDVSSPETMPQIVDSCRQRFGRIDVLVNNAGVYGPKGAIDEIDWAEWLRAIEINLMGSVLAFRAVLPVFKAQGAGAIIQLSGGGATNPLPFISAYAASKAAIVRLVETVAQEVHEHGISINAIAPGALNTRMLNEVLDAGPEKVGAAFYAQALKQRETGGAGFSAAVDLAVFLAGQRGTGISGKLISALWDNWRDWPARANELSHSDAYTLRRIAGRDRGMSWGDKS